MKANRDKIIKFAQDYLKVDSFSDHCNNGLQIEGQKEIKKIITAVSFSQELIHQALEKKAQMILVHHGVFNKEIPELFKLEGVVKERIKLLLENDINLGGFHLPLDAHGVIGNNISLAKLFNLKNKKVFSDIGIIGELEKAKNIESFIKEVEEKLNTRSYTIKAGNKNIKKIAIISGGGSSWLEEAVKAEADLFLTGEIKESVVRKIEEYKINYISAGHYNTEKLGIYNLGKMIAKKFNIQHEFIDIPTDV